MSNAIQILDSKRKKSPNCVYGLRRGWRSADKKINKGKRYSAFRAWPYFKPSRGWTLTTTFLTFPCLLAAASLSLSLYYFSTSSLFSPLFRWWVSSFLFSLSCYYFSSSHSPAEAEKILFPSYFGGPGFPSSFNLFPPTPTASVASLLPDHYAFFS